MKEEPLSDTIFCGSPCVVNKSLSFAMVFSDVMDFMICTSSHFEYVSTVTRYMCPKKDLQNLSVIDSMAVMAIPMNVMELYLVKHLFVDM